MPWLRLDVTRRAALGFGSCGKRKEDDTQFDRARPTATSSSEAKLIVDYLLGHNRLAIRRPVLDIALE